MIIERNAVMFFLFVPRRCGLNSDSKFIAQVEMLEGDGEG